MADLMTLVDDVMDENSMYRIEGRKGVENLCKLVRMLGYKDPQYYGQLTRDAYIGDLIMFLEDNSGAIESVINWVREQNVDEWVDNLQKIKDPEVRPEEYDEE